MQIQAGCFLLLGASHYSFPKHSQASVHTSPDIQRVRMFLRVWGGDEVSGFNFSVSTVGPTSFSLLVALGVVGTLQLDHVGSCSGEPSLYEIGPLGGLREHSNLSNEVNFLRYETCWEEIAVQYLYWIFVLYYRSYFLLFFSNLRIHINTNPKKHAPLDVDHTNLVGPSQTKPQCGDVVFGSKYQRWDSLNVQHSTEQTINLNQLFHRFRRMIRMQKIQRLRLSMPWVCGHSS